MAIPINYNKVNFIVATEDCRVRDAGKNITIRDYNIEVVNEFIYLDAVINPSK